MEERQIIEDRTAGKKKQGMFSVGLSVGVLRRIFEWPDIRKCNSVRIS